MNGKCLQIEPIEAGLVPVVFDLYLQPAAPFPYRVLRWPSMTRSRMSPAVASAAAGRDLGKRWTHLSSAGMRHA